MSDSRPVSADQKTEASSDSQTISVSDRLGNGTASNEDSRYSFDIQKLHSLPSEQQSVFLLGFTADLAKHVDSLDADGATAEQVALQAVLFQVIQLSQPAPTRVIRNNLGRCFYGILAKGSRKILYESINSLVALLNAPLKERDLRSKHAALSCLGAVFDAAGDSAVSLSPLACMSVLKLLKLTSNDTGCRASIFKTLAKIIRGVKTPLDEDVARGIWKQTRNTVGNDKALLVQQSGCVCLEQLLCHTAYFDNSNDFEKLQGLLIKVLDNSCVPVRHAAASCFATALVKNYSEHQRQTAPKIRKPRKSKKGPKAADELDQEVERAASPAPEKPATALSFTLMEMLRIISTQYVRSSTNQKARAGLAVVYIKVIKMLGESVVETKYGEIAQHFFVEILSYPGFNHANYKQLTNRKFVRIILTDVVGTMLGESAQLTACRFLVNEIIKDYPQTIKERPEPSTQTLAGALSALTSLMRNLDAATSGIADITREGLLQVLQHPSRTVQVHAARALRTFVLVVPQQILPAITICMNSVARELSQLSGQRQDPRRCVGYAYGLAAALSVSSQRALHGSVDVYARVLQQATGLLKTSSSSDIRISSCQIHVAWIMIGGLMSLGPNFVKIHLPQLMLLWKNALPRPVAKENMAQRNLLELAFLAHVRECALGSIKAFLTYNQRLLTTDISRRLTGMLENTVAFLQNLPEKRTSEDPSNRILSTFQLHDLEVMTRRRVFQCFCQLLVLSPSASLESTAHSAILPLAVASFSDAEYFAANSSLSVAIASAAASLESIWEVADNVGFGVNGLIRGLDVQNPVGRQIERHWSSRREVEDEIARTIISPIANSPECDSISCFLAQSDESESLNNPPETETVNAAIAAFGLCLPLQSHRIQESTLEQVASSMNENTSQKDSYRKKATVANIALALLTACKVASGESGSAKGDMKHQNVEKAMQSLLHSCLKDDDDIVRHIAAEALGRLCCTSGSAFAQAEVAYLTETIVKNREPHVRAGCALALASMYTKLGGMSAGLHMKNIVGMLMSLAADAHPLVHVWALDALSRVAESAGLNFSGFVSSCLGMLRQLYAADSHNPETSGLAWSNMSMNLAVVPAIARGVDALINVMGPDLQDMSKAREMTLSLVHSFSSEDDVETILESLKCMEHISLYAPEYAEFKHYVRRLQSGIDHDHAEVQEASLHGLFIAMRRDSDAVIQAARPGLEDRLWEFLNGSPNQPSVHCIFTNWLQQTGLRDPADWIRRCNMVLTKTKSKAEPVKATAVKDTPAPDIQDDEVAGFAASAGVNKEEDAALPSSTQELMRWQVRHFAMELMYDLLSMIRKEAAVTAESPGEAALQQKVADVIRLAFSASTSGVSALRVVGLKIIDQILVMFGHTADPDFPEAMLLEQYQAQISSALTPAFASDSSPELAAEAVNVCATFIANGIVTDVERMGRILKLLVSALDSFSKDSEMASIGDLKGLSSNAQVMVRSAVFSAWAELQIATADQKYLVDVVGPHITQLVPLWLSSLREYARLRFEPDISATTASVPSGDLEVIYATFNRETLLQFYQNSWLNLVDAIASLIEEDSEFVFDALDGRHMQQEEPGPDGEDNQVNGVRRKSAWINYREEPVAFFFLLFGLTFESLAVRSKDDDIANMQRNMDILRALKKILLPSVSGNAVYQEVVFAETMDLLDRMVLTESLGVQTIIVEIARNLCLAHPSSKHGVQSPSTGETLSDDIEQLFELTRIIVLVLAGLVPGLSERPISAHLETSDEAVLLVHTAIQALVDVADVFPSIIKTDLHATILHIFVTVLGTGACQATVVPQALPIFKRFISSIANDGQTETRDQLRSTLGRMQIILSNCQRRETEASLPCEKNTLLAITILLSTAPAELHNSDPLVTRFAAELYGCLEAPTTSRVAAGCMRTLLLNNVAASTLFADSVRFMITPSDLEGISDSKSLVAQTMTMYIEKLPGAQQRPAAMAVVTHALLQRATVDGPRTYQETAARLLELAGTDNIAFRSIMTSMQGQQRQLLERILKTSADARRTRDESASDREPSIALKMQF